DVLRRRPAVVVPAVKGDGAVVRRLLEDGPQQRRLARAVQADQCGDPAARHAGRDPFQDRLVAEADPDVVERQQAGVHRSALVNSSRLARMRRSYQPASSASLNDSVSSGSSSMISTSFTPLLSNSLFSVAAAPLCWNCGSVAMT